MLVPEGEASVRRSLVGSLLLGPGGEAFRGETYPLGSDAHHRYPLAVILVELTHQMRRRRRGTVLPQSVHSTSS